MGARRFSLVEIRHKEVKVPDLYFAVMRLAVMATGAAAVVIFVR